MDLTTTDQLVESFKKAFPDFKSFEDSGATLKREELDYKHELSTAFRELGDLLLNEECPDFIEQFQDLLKRKLDSTNKPQNLVGWREQEALSNVLNSGEPTRNEFCSQVHKLLVAADDRTSVGTAIDDFVEWIVDHKLSAAQTKVWPTLILSLWRPEMYIFIKPRFFDSVLERLGFEKLGSGTRLTGEAYRRVMKDLETIKSHLSSLHISNFIELQSFLWMIDSSSANGPRTSLVKRMGCGSAQSGIFCS